MRLPFLLERTMDAVQDPNSAVPERAKGESSLGTEEFREPATDQVFRANEGKADEKTEFEISVRKLTRRNGGPRTQRGKERSRGNAVKHGIFGKIVLAFGESTAQFNSLLEGLRLDFQPQGTVEKILVEKLASLTWRYRRLLKTEKAEIERENRYNSRIIENDVRNSKELLTLNTSRECLSCGLFVHRDNPLVRREILYQLDGLQKAVSHRGFAPP